MKEAPGGGCKAAHSRVEAHLARVGLKVQEVEVTRQTVDLVVQDRHGQVERVQSVAVVAGDCLGEALAMVLVEEGHLFWVPLEFWLTTSKATQGAKAMAASSSQLQVQWPHPLSQLIPPQLLPPVLLQLQQLSSFWVPLPSSSKAVLRFIPSLTVRPDWRSALAEV